MERRQHPRVSRPLDAHWQGASANGHCRVGDVSLGGCFIQTLAMPRHGEATVITLSAQDGPLKLPGKVVYVDPAMGFAVQFDELEPNAEAELRRFIDALLDPTHPQ
ncbi:MAG: PilZ domain-containing protein [Vicinamibacterales bacterium]